MKQFHRSPCASTCTVLGHNLLARDTHAYSYSNVDDDDAAASHNHTKLYLSIHGYVHSVIFRHSSSERKSEMGEIPFSRIRNVFSCLMHHNWIRIKTNSVLTVHPSQWRRKQGAYAINTVSMIIYGSYRSVTRTFVIDRISILQRRNIHHFMHRRLVRLSSSS